MPGDQHNFASHLETVQMALERLGPRAGVAPREALDALFARLDEVLCEPLEHAATDLTEAVKSFSEQVLDQQTTSAASYLREACLRLGSSTGG